MEHKHTAGPWSMDGAGTKAMVRGADLTIVAVRHRLTGPTHEANARLIAASPAMYDFVKKCAAKGNREAIGILESIHA